jgi:hypothetical protein
MRNTVEISLNVYKTYWYRPGVSESDSTGKSEFCIGNSKNAHKSFLWRPIKYFDWTSWFNERIINNKGNEIFQ